MSLKHNKKRSTGIIYELLLRKASEQLIDQDKRGLKETVDLIQRFFHEEAPIGRELSLFETARAARGSSPAVIRRVLSTVMSEAKKLDRRELDTKKSSLIKELHRRYGQGFFGQYRLADYKMLASLQILMNQSSGRLNESLSPQDRVDVARIEEALVAALSVPQPESQPVDPKMDGLAYGFAVKKLQERYGSILGGPQKEILTEYTKALFSGDERKFREKAVASARQIHEAILDGMRDPELSKDSVLVERLKESSRHLRDLDVRRSPMEIVAEELILFHDLVKEISSDA